MEPHTDLENPVEAYLGYQMRRASVLMMDVLAARLAGLGLKVTEAAILALVRANPGITQSDIGRVLAIQRANMVPLAAGLTARKLIARQDQDSRAHPLHLTTAGEALAKKAEACMLKNDEKFFATMAPAERGRFLAQLRALRAAAE